MPRLLLNGANLEMTGATWGGLLEVLDDHVAAMGHIVTDVRFDGIDEPAFREPRIMVTPLTDMATVEVSSGTPESLVRRCLEEAASSIEPLCQAALAIGDGFRGQDIESASADLAELADGMSTLIAIAGAATLASGAPPAVGSLATELTGFVDALVAAQRARDWLAAADILQYDVEPALRRWAPAFAAARPETLDQASA